MLQFIGPNAEFVERLSIHHMASWDLFAEIDHEAQYRKTAGSTEPFRASMALLGHTMFKVALHIDLAGITHADCSFTFSMDCSSLPKY